MPLNTEIYILDEIDPHKVFNFCNDLMDAGKPIFTEAYDEWQSNPIISLDNTPGQGLPAWLMSNYRKRGPLYPMAQYEEDDDGNRRLVTPACFMEISFDTAYGYRDSYGGSTELHGRYIVALHDWLKKRGVEMCWKNEFNGTIYRGKEGLEGFFHGGDRANDWFENSVLPVFKNLNVEVF
jgi:hypothetical protein